MPGDSGVLSLQKFVPVRPRASAIESSWSLRHLLAKPRPMTWGWSMSCRFSLRTSSRVLLQFTKASSLVITSNAPSSWIQLYAIVPLSVSMSSARYTGMPEGEWYRTLFPDCSKSLNIASGMKTARNRWFSGSIVATILPVGT